MPVRNAEAAWQGTLKDGNGQMSLGSGGVGFDYSFESRFEQGSGTNPEELIGAAQAGCFSMALSAAVEKAGFAPTRIATTAEVHINKTAEGWTIPRIDLRTQAEIPGISEQVFQELAEDTKSNCPVSRLLSAAEITLEAKLVG